MKYFCANRWEDERCGNKTMETGNKIGRLVGRAGIKPHLTIDF
jgi:hypothetical protein